MQKKKIQLFILAFMFPILLIIILSIFFKISAEKVMMFGDMQTQYTGFYSYLRQVLLGKESILYSFSSGLGSNFLMDYYYYLSSPLNIIILLIPNIFKATFIILLIKIGFSSLTMSIYLKRNYSLSNYWILLLSICYSLMAFSISFYINLMWFDAIILMPLVVMSIENYIKQDISYEYIIIMVLLIFSNYYISFACLIFNFIYFISSLPQSQENIKKKIFRFLKMNILVFLICSIVIIPAFINVLHLAKTRSIDYLELTTLTDRVIAYFNVILQLFPLSTTNYNFSYANVPNIYCSLLIPIIVILFYLKRNKILKKERKVTFLVLLIFILSFSTNIVSLIFSGFSHTFGYYYRFSFLFSLYMIVLCARYLEKNNFFNIKLTKKYL